jgi:hypothetical protein
MSEFLEKAEIEALEKVIAKARAAAGIHREPTPSGEAIAYQYLGEITWCVNGGQDEANLARGMVPLKRR